MDVVFMKQLAVTALTLLCCGTLANSAEFYITDAPKSADVWVIQGPASVADCWIYTGDVSNEPIVSLFWLYVTDSAQAADKWVVFTDNPSLSDPVECLKRD